MRQGTPLTACPIQVQNGIDHFSDVGGSWVSAWLGGGDERLEDGPFLLGQITGVTESIHCSTSSHFPLVLLFYSTTFRTASQDILIFGSVELIHSLMQEDLIDEYRLMVFPIVVGNGKLLFHGESQQKAFKLVQSQTFGSGVVVLTYEPNRK